MGRMYHYTGVTRSSHGTMACTICNHPITHGRYRYYYKSNGNLCDQHEACCQDDPEWAAIDRREADWLDFCKRRSDACKAFAAEWKLGDSLDEYIFGETP